MPMYGSAGRGNSSSSAAKREETPKPGDARVMEVLNLRLGEAHLGGRFALTCDEAKEPNPHVDKVAALGCKTKGGDILSEYIPEWPHKAST